MPYQREIDENFKFLLLEVKSQVGDALQELREPGAVSRQQANQRDDYIDNLKGVIENKCFSQIFYDGVRDKPSIDLVKAVIVVTSNLERIADYALNIIRQTDHYKNRNFIERFNFEGFFEEIFAALDVTHDALFTRDTQLGLVLARSELKIDKMYEDVFSDILVELRSGKQVEDLLTTVFIFRYLERIGDSLLNIGEAVISSTVGEKLKIHQFEALEETLAKSEMEAHISDFSFESIWETRSGSRITRMQARTAGDSVATLFKRGSRLKIEAERESIERWQALVPGLPPRVFGRQEDGDSASLLLEYFSGHTFEELLLGAGAPAVNEAFGRITETLQLVWGRTMKPGEVNAQHLKQLLKRLQHVHRVHPDYITPPSRIGHLESPPFMEMVRRGLHIDESLPAPFTVMIHGDLNIDNIIYDTGERRVHFIDLHRSKDSDYVQDVSVFMVSVFRLPVHDLKIRQRLNAVADDFYEFAGGFAASNRDSRFDARLALGLVRSFASSTRFELKEEFAKNMFLRARFLLERLLDHEGRPWEEFRLPREALIY